MKFSFTFLLLFFFGLISNAQSSADEQKVLDSIENSFKFDHGTLSLKGGIGEIKVPQGFKYLEPVQAEHVLTDLWGNPKGESVTLGLLLPENSKVLSPGGYVFNIQYDEIGYVKDDDADDIDYEELLEEMQTEASDANKERVKAGYEAISIVGWAAKPYYDANRKILHWAKEIKFGNSPENTLNYNIRVLGRKGVLVLNAISGMENLKLVQKDIPKVLDVVQFSDGNRYTDFDSKIDNVAAWTLGGLVAGKVLAKVGILTAVLKFWKIIAIAIMGGFGAIRRFFGRKQEEKPEVVAEEMEEPEETKEV